MDKKIIRQIMKEKRLSYKESTLSLLNDQIKQKILESTDYKQSDIIGIYVSINQEVDTLEIIKEALQTKRVCVPKAHGKTMDFYEIHSLDELEEGTFHCLEPVTTDIVKPEDICVMYTPLLAYDQDLYRCGYGGGYYDRYFSGFKGKKVGLAYSFQYVEHIEHDEYDIPLDEIITD